jgi:hypothetical protein
MCPKTYSATVSTNAGGFSLNLFTFDSSTRQFTIYTQSADEIGTYTVTITAFITSSPSQTQTGTITVEVLTSCIVTELTLVPDRIESLATFIGFSNLSLRKYNFNDTISFAETLSTDSEDFCGEKVISFTLDDVDTELLNYTIDGLI